MLHWLLLRCAWLHVLITGVCCVLLCTALVCQGGSTPVHYLFENKAFSGDVVQPTVRMIHELCPDALMAKQKVSASAVSC